MAKPPKATIPLKTSDPIVSPQPDTGVSPTSSYFLDLNAMVALESLSQEFLSSGGKKPESEMNVTVQVSESQPDTTVIYHKDGAYYVYFNAGELAASWWGVNLASFSQWAMSLKPDDVVYFYQTGSIFYIPLWAQILSVLDTQCLAKKIFVVDHMIDTPLFLFICDEVCIDDLGAISFRSCVDLVEASVVEKAFLPYLGKLYERGVAKKLLTDDEAHAIMVDNLIVFKTARQLKSQMDVTQV